MGKKKSNTTSTVAPPSWAVPIIQGGAQSLSNTYNQNQGNLQNLASSITGGVLPGIQNQMQQQGQQLQPGYGYINSTLGSNPGMSNPSNSYLQGQLDPGFLSANPSNAGYSAYGNGNYLNENNAAVQQLANYAGQQAGNAVNSTFSLAGRTGSDNHATDLARGVTQAELAPMLQNNQFEQQLQMQGLAGLGSNYNTAVGQQQNAANLLGSNYNYGLGIQNSAAGMLPGYTQSQFTGYTPLLGATQLAGQLPYYGSSTIGQIGSLLGNYGTTSGTQPGGWGTDLLGAAASALPFIPGI